MYVHIAIPQLQCYNKLNSVMLTVNIFGDSHYRDLLIHSYTF